MVFNAVIALSVPDMEKEEEVVRGVASSVECDDDDDDEMSFKFNPCSLRLFKSSLFS